MTCCSEKFTQAFLFFLLKLNERFEKATERASLKKKWSHMRKCSQILLSQYLYICSLLYIKGIFVMV